jgi:uncharacterized surface protein with fasciclin (FAS1) repeats
MVLSRPVTLKVMGDKVMLNNATVVTADVEASNGVIHVVDTVLMPSAASSSGNQPKGMGGSSY